MVDKVTNLNWWVYRISNEPSTVGTPKGLSQLVTRVNLAPWTFTNIPSLNGTESQRNL